MLCPKVHLKNLRGISSVTDAEQELRLGAAAFVRRIQQVIPQLLDSDNRAVGIRDRHVMQVSVYSFGSGRDSFRLVVFAIPKPAFTLGTFACPSCRGEGGRGRMRTLRSESRAAIRSAMPQAD